MIHENALRLRDSDTQKLRQSEQRHNQGNQASAIFYRRSSKQRRTVTSLVHCLSAEGILEKSVSSNITNDY